MFDLDKLPWERRSLDDFGFEGVSAEMRRLTHADYQHVANPRDREKIRELVVENVRAVEGVVAGDEPVTDVERLFELAPPALTNALTRALTRYSALTESMAKNS